MFGGASKKGTVMFSMNRKADKDKVVNYDQTPKETVNINKPSEVIPSYQGTIENRLENPDKFELEAQRADRKRRSALRLHK
jgi:hypothetical protein